MVKFELKKHYLVKPKITDPFLSRFRTVILGSTGIVATRSNTTYTENLEVTGEIRQHGGSRFNFINESLEVWDSRTESWRELTPSFRMTTRIPIIKGNIFKKIYDYFIQRFSI